MDIAVALIHDKGVTGNNQQITDLANRLTWNTVPSHPLGGYYNNANLPAHRFYVFQIVPYTVNIPSNFSNLRSINIYYGADRPTPNYLLWAIKRAIEWGADGGMYVDDVSQLTLANIQAAVDHIQASDATVSDEPFGKIAVRRYLSGRVRNG